ncbi:MAG: alpha-amylase [Clostridium sartagoforme]|nr:alpha-amylase [Clostridium sartagoforme]
MADNTNNTLKNSVIYSIYVRNYGENGNFKDVEKDLKRIEDIGVDIIWLMPIHPIGVKNKKGLLGCPYAIKNYREVNPEYGTLEDFKDLIDSIHSLGMKCIIDVVYHHTSPDSYLSEVYPEYFYKKADGSFGNKVGDWSDIIDLDYSNKKLWDYLIDTLKYWVSIGVDGFRCDVASLVPLEFWIKAREEVSKINKDTIWLAESVHQSFIREIRKAGFIAHSDCELYRAFDICYDYDVNEEYINYLDGKGRLDSYIEKVRQQETIYPSNYIKLRFLENHDQPRIASKIKDIELLKTWTKFMYFQKGTTLLYNGQESMETHTPSLFDIDKIRIKNQNEELTDLMQKLYEIKKLDIIRDGFYDINIIPNTEVVIASYTSDTDKIIGIFNLSENTYEVNLENGKYLNIIDNEEINISNGKINLTKNGFILKEI